MSILPGGDDDGDDDGGEGDKGRGGGSGKGSRLLKELESSFKAEVRSKLRTKGVPYDVRRSGRRAKDLSGRLRRESEPSAGPGPAALPEVKRGEKRWDQLTRPSFYPWTRQDVLDRMQPGARPGTYRCPCKKYGPHDVTEAEIEIDHKLDWKTWILGHAGDGSDPTRDQAKEAYNDLSNLRGMCGPGNASKGGSKGKY